MFLLDQATMGSPFGRFSFRHESSSKEGVTAFPGRTASSSRRAEAKGVDSLIATRARSPSASSSFGRSIQPRNSSAQVSGEASAGAANCVCCREVSAARPIGALKTAIPEAIPRTSQLGEKRPGSSRI